MAVARVHTLYGVSMGATVVGGLRSASIRTNNQVRGDLTDGEVSPRALSLVAQSAGANWTTLAVATWLGQVGISGLAISTLTGGASLYAQLAAAGGTRATGETHRKYNFLKGLILPRRLSADHQGDATLEYELLAVSSDGLTAPYTITDACALPTPSNNTERYTLGPIKIGGVSLTHVTSLELDFGITARLESADSDIWDTMAWIERIEPTITLRGIDVEWLKTAAIPPSGLAGSHANTSIYLRKRAADGTYVANNVAEHIELTAAGLATVSEPMTVSAEGRAEVSIAFQLSYDGTNDAVEVDTASTIA